MTADTWIPLPEGTPFPLSNLPYGMFDAGDGLRVGVAIGDQILDATAGADDGLIDTVPAGTLSTGNLDTFAGLGPEAWRATRERVGDLLTDRSASGRVQLIPRSSVRMQLPVGVGDFVDFYSSLHHAGNVGAMFRPDQEPLLPNWRHLPLGYHGRSSTVVVSGTEVRRPLGQRLGPRGPLFGPTTRLDFELEVGFVVGPGNPDGAPIPTGEAESHIFGLLLVNDWSARDVQAWEYVPLGPFLGKSFATTVSPWVVPLAALEPYRLPPPPQEPEAMPHLRTTGPTAVDLRLTAAVNGTVVTRTRFAGMYWTMAQQIAHLTSNGTVVRPGDLCASGTVSGPDPGSQGCLLELSWNGTRPITLDDGSTRTFLEDGDTVVMTAAAGDIGFGECAGTVVPATS